MTEELVHRVPQAGRTASGEVAVRPKIDDEGGVWAPGRRAVAFGLILTITLVAFEALAVSVVLPIVAADLNGLPLYGWVMSAFFLGNLVGIVAAGRQIDARGPARPFIVGLVLFGIGLTIGGLSPAMGVLVAARAVQGFGAGAIAPVAYVSIGRTFPEAIRGRMFAYLSTAWVVPGLVGPALAGWVALHIGWRIVFLGLLPLIVLAAALTVPSLHRMPDPEIVDPPADGRLGDQGAADAGRPDLRSAIRLAIGAALVLGGLSPASLVLGLAPDGFLRTLGGPALALLGLPFIVLGLAVALPALRALTPPGTLRGARGLPAAVLLRGILTFSFFGPDTFVPLALQGIRHVDAAQAGLALTAATLSWTAGSWIQAHRMPVGGEQRFIRAGFAVVLVGVASTALILSPAVPVWVALPTWAITGFGMGLSYSPISLFVIRKAVPGAEGAATSGLTLADTLGTALGAGLAGAFVALAVSFGWEPWLGVAAAFAAGVTGAAAGFLYAGRLRERPV
jgi:MFS family permease